MDLTTTDDTAKCIAEMQAAIATKKASASTVEEYVYGMLSGKGKLDYLRYTLLTD
jgi:hypothetical protein